MILTERYCLRLPEGLKDRFLSLSKEVERRDGADVLRLFMEDMIQQWTVDKKIDEARKAGATVAQLRAIIDRD